MPRRFVSALYGLRITGPWPLGPPPPAGADWPELELVHARVPLVAHLAPSERAARRRDWFRRVRLADGSDYLRWTGLAEFLVSPDGCRIVCRTFHGCSREALRAYLLGQVFSFALARRGIEPLHATAVAIDGEAVGFLGDCGRGKSSLAASFLEQGATLLTDDLLVLRDHGGRQLAYPGPPRIKLFPHVARRLLGPGTAGTPMNPGTAKLVIPVGARRSSAGGPLPLRAIYVLARPARGRRVRVATRRLAPRRAFLALVRNTFNPVLAEPARLGRLLDEAARLALAVPVRSLSFPRRLAALPDVRRAILADLAA